MSEDAKLAYLQEKIREAKRNERTGLITMFLGGLSIVLGISFNIIWNNSFTFFGVVSLIILGVFMFILGIYASGHYNGQYRDLMGEFEKLAIKVPICSNCKKELPKGNFEFCPFCGKSLKSNE